MLDNHKHMASGGLSIALRGARAEQSLAELHFSYAHIFYVTRTVSAEDSLGRTLVLEGVPSNGTDAGEYGGSADLFGVNLAVHFGAIARGGGAGEGAK